MPSDPNQINDRKLDHIQLAFESQTQNAHNFGLHYEPMLSAHPSDIDDLGLDFLGKKLRAPLWVSSMTGGTAKARTINANLARACGEFGLGMGLGSCRPLLEGSERLQDFAVKKYMGDYPLYANLGIAQIEQILKHKTIDKVNQMMSAIQADGLFIHVNPLQEWMQPEGDFISNPPIETIESFLEHFEYPVVVKEVGQGFGPKSMKALVRLPIAGIEFAAFGGTNFTKLEHARHSEEASGTNELLTLAYIGHNAHDMVEWSNQALLDAQTELNQKCNIDFIVSGGIKNVIAGYGLISKIQAPAVIGMASQFLKYAMDDYSVLQLYIESQIKLLKMAQCYLK
jgi:isopentenyl-diphosphate delta-isomerase